MASNNRKSAQAVEQVFDGASRSDSKTISIRDAQCCRL
jgi:hypothetical protein